MQRFRSSLGTQWSQGGAGAPKPTTKTGGCQRARDTPPRHACPKAPVWGRPGAHGGSPEGQGAARSPRPEAVRRPATAPSPRAEGGRGADGAEVRGRGEVTAGASGRGSGPGWGGSGGVSRRPPASPAHHTRPRPSGRERQAGRPGRAAGQGRGAEGGREERPPSGSGVSPLAAAPLSPRPVAPVPASPRATAPAARGPHAPT